MVQRFLGRKCQRMRYLDEGHQGNESCLVSETQPPCSPKPPSKALGAGSLGLTQSPICPQASSCHPHPQVCILRAKAKEGWGGGSEKAGFVREAAHL